MIDAKRIEKSRVESPAGAGWAHCAVLGRRRRADRADAHDSAPSPRPPSNCRSWCSACPSRRKTRCAANRAPSMRSPRAPRASRPCARGPTAGRRRRGHLEQAERGRGRRRRGPDRRGDHQASNQEVRELAPKLLSELGDLAQCGGRAEARGDEPVSGALRTDGAAHSAGFERFGRPASAMPARARSAWRTAWNSSIRSMRGLSGEESGMALTKVTGADAEQRLKTVVPRNQQYSNSVRKAIGAAEPLVQGASGGARIAGRWPARWRPN